MTTVDTGRECLDLKKMWKWFVHKIWIVIAAAIAGAIIGVLAGILIFFLLPNLMKRPNEDDSYIEDNKDAIEDFMKA